MSRDQFELGDVFWALDPYNAGGDPQPWFVVTADTIPYSGEEYICAGLTLSDFPDNIETQNKDWVAGNTPDKISYQRPLLGEGIAQSIDEPAFS
ncbi:hypothetical protein [Haloarcula laminariae]|uniref:hypothetical protein n=1 Tax=Haloarcula laminariae TaxID=2961577 RepID=UPI002404F12C|nr:hypothetical protein [Halomicroarcula sp. FL173]